MPYTVTLSKGSKKFIDKLQKKIKDNYTKWRDNDLTHDPFSANDGRIKKSHYTKETVYKKKFGSTRFLYIINEEKKDVLIFKADNRGDVYKNI